MNRLTGSSTCRICRTWLESGFSAADAAGRVAILRQVRNGMCDRCQRERQAAALQLMKIADEIRIYHRLGMDPPASLAEVCRQAEQRCYALLMWPPVRRSNTARYRENGAMNDHHPYR